MTFATLLDLAQALVDQVSLDENGMMIGQTYQGGNGGMLSRDTVIAADALRKAIDSIRGTPPDDPDLDRAMRRRAAENQL